MKTIKYLIITVAAALGLSSCNDFLEVYPENVEPTDKYWASKEDVEATLFAGYYYLRDAVQDYLIPWGELRAGCIYSRSGSPLQQLQVKPTSSIATWTPMYMIVNSANLVLANAEKARANDATYTPEAMNSHYCEAYWLRALAYFYIVRNWREAPLFTEPFETDEVSYNVAKSSEAELIAQIKSDLLAAIQLGAAKTSFNTTWETKGRATLWSIYALMADVCLWNQDFDEAITYCNAILNATSNDAPRFMKTPTHASWFSIFNPGNSNESIYEVQWSHEKRQGTAYQTNDLPKLFDNQHTDRRYQLSRQMLQDFNSEYRAILQQYNNDPDLAGPMAVRSMFGGYFVGSSAAAYQGATSGYVWKYCGSTSLSDKRTETYYDPNFIIYRVADIMLLKAEALVMRQAGNNQADNEEAIALVNEIRQRTNLEPVEIFDEPSLKDLLDYILYERLMELVGEGKAWYDLLRVGRYKDPAGVVNFKKDFLIEYVTKYNGEASEAWINSVLNDENAWYLPINENEVKVNQLLEQNPYYL